VNHSFSSPAVSETLLLCIAPSRSQAHAIMRRLEAENFTDDHISVVFPDTGARTTPGLGAFIAAGPIIDALRAVTTAASAGIASGLVSLGIAAPRARRCQEQLEEGNFLLSVHTSNREQAERARRILAIMGGQDICTPGESEAGPGWFDGAAGLPQAERSA
jgi:hypothetical protein